MINEFNMKGKSTIHKTVSGLMLVSSVLELVYKLLEWSFNFSGQYFRGNKSVLFILPPFSMEINSSRK